MKKFILLALVVLASAFLTPAVAGGKKEKKDKKAKSESNAPVMLVTPSDSMSYAAGISFNNGLDQYLSQQYQIGEADWEALITYFKEFAGKRKATDFQAMKAAINVIGMLEERMLPGITNDFANTPDSIQEELFYQGFIDGMAKNYTLFTDSAARGLVETRAAQYKADKESAYRTENEQWLKENATKPDVITLPSGLQYKVLVMGKGKVVGPDDDVTVKYEGKMIDGTVFDSSYTRTPDTNVFKPSQVIKGWTEALTMMPAGSVWELYIPQELAYGSRPAGKIKPYSTLIFKVEVME